MKNFKSVITEASSLYAIVADYNNYDESIENIYTNKNSAMSGAQKLANQLRSTITVIQFKDGLSPSNDRQSKVVANLEPKR